MTDHGPGSAYVSAPFPHWLAWMLTNPLRALWLTPQALIGRLQIRPSDRILEIGPGAGYFSVELAKQVPQGHLELLDIQPQMLEKVRRRLAAAVLRPSGVLAIHEHLPDPAGARARCPTQGNALTTTDDVITVIT